MFPKASFVALALLAAVAACPGAAYAAPPTVIPSPGYDARLQQSRKVTSTASTPDEGPSSAKGALAHRHRARPAHHTH